MNQLKLNNETGAAWKGILIGCLFGLLGLGIFAYTFGYVVPPGMMGVRRIGFGPGQGYSHAILRPGYHWGIPFLSYSTVHLVPETVQSIHLLSEESGDNSMGRLDVQTTDGAKVHVDVTLFTRFYPEAGEDGGLKHGGLVDLFEQVGLDSQDWRNRIRRNADDSIRRGLGQLSAAEFYDPHKREAQVESAQKEMNEKLARFGVKVEAVLLRRYTYEADAINEAIFRKNLQDQEERLNATLSALAEVNAELEQKRADYDARIKTLLTEGESQRKVLMSEGDLSEQRKIAEGDLLVAKRRAEVDRLRAGVLSQSAGADIYVARELAPIVSSLKGGVVSELDPYDLESWLGRLGVGERRTP